MEDDEWQQQQNKQSNSPDQLLNDASHRIRKMNTHRSIETTNTTESISQPCKEKVNDSIGQPNKPNGSNRLNRIPRLLGRVKPRNKSSQSNQSTIRIFHQPTSSCKDNNPTNQQTVQPPPDHQPTNQSSKRATNHSNHNNVWPPRSTKTPTHS